MLIAVRSRHPRSQSSIARALLASAVCVSALPISPTRKLSDSDVQPYCPSNGVSGCPCVEQVFTCDPFGESSCGSVYMPPQQEQVNVPWEVTKDLFATSQAVVGALGGDPLGLIGLPFKFMNNGGSDDYNVDPQFVSEMAMNVQNYVAQDVSTATLNLLYDGITGNNNVFQLVASYYAQWQKDLTDGADPTAVQLAWNNLNNLIINNQATFVKNYPLYASGTPWSNPTGTNSVADSTKTGSNGWGIYYSAYVTQMLIGFMQGIALEGMDESMPFQQSVVEYSWKGIKHAWDLIDAYLEQREGDVQGPTLESENPIYYEVKDSWAYYQGASATATQSCTWKQDNLDGESVIMPPLYPEFVQCGQSTTDFINSQSTTCMKGRKQFVTGPIVNNWNHWLIGPSKQWAKLTDWICQNTTDSAVQTMCNNQGEATNATYNNQGGTAADFIANLEASPEALPYKVQQTCQANYPGANVLAAPITTTAGGCNDYFKSAQPDAGVARQTQFWDQGNAGVAGWTCCLASDQTPECPNDWTPVTQAPASSAPFFSDYQTYCVDAGATSCCRAPASYQGSCAHYSGNGGANWNSLSSKESWGNSCHSTWSVYPTMDTVPQPCSQCLMGYSDCAAACQALIGTTSGTCENSSGGPWSTNTADCCTCTN